MGDFGKRDFQIDALITPNKEGKGPSLSNYWYSEGLLDSLPTWVLGRNWPAFTT